MNNLTTGDYACRLRYLLWIGLVIFKKTELRAINEGKVLTIDEFNEEKYKQLIEDLKPDFDTYYDKEEEDGLIFTDME